jgi:DNA polymerase I-like protein with 3'-5' exonuclease and polymerase domains
MLGTNIILPNIRKLYKPDPGFIIFEADLAGADAQVVAWEADDAPLKQAFRDYLAGVGPKVHCVNAKAIFGAKAGETGTVEPYYSRAKAGVHLTNYGGKGRTLSMALGCSLFEAESFQRDWFRMHPAIRKWHDKIGFDLQSKRQVRNPFGFVRTYFDHVDGLLPQGLAWIPQSTVAIIIDTAMNRIVERLPNVQILLQVHDSLVGQVRIEEWKATKPRLHQCFQVVVPYPDPLIIPTDLKTSTVSWGDCKKEKWVELELVS